MAEMPSITVKVGVDTLAAMESVKQIIRDTVFLYSEWLDSEGLLKKPKKDDLRSHDNLVSEFIDTHS